MFLIFLIFRIYPKKRISTYQMTQLVIIIIASESE